MYQLSTRVKTFFSPEKTGAITLSSVLAASSLHDLTVQANPFTF
jgi:hypothetical protein